MGKGGLAATGELASIVFAVEGSVSSKVSAGSAFAVALVQDPQPIISTTFSLKVKGGRWAFFESF